MFSQSLFAQLLRMGVLLTLTLVAVHHYQPLLDLFAQEAVNSGCHQSFEFNDEPTHHVGHHNHHSHH
ncbi:hypothetical protein BCU68_15975 [Vibrio sp. 10N.286.49.B3]|uniref:hypothetical protein n=1 Tax=Vibrio sp. 10N.286.49.B3 TaxID=1880855 RepID=UPI000C83EF14|nr:hypothetical protein [Vibrio sp. 10N.286.49.B3]PMH40867.1 hypothetical protein BCU68_15975 [Vibrio sp. 10N.286.49.B3]